MPSSTAKKIKCVLEAHYRIPSPILMILMGNLPQVSSSIEDVTDESLEDSQIIKAPKEGRSSTLNSMYTTCSFLIALTYRWLEQSGFG